MPRPSSRANSEEAVSNPACGHCGGDSFNSKCNCTSLLDGSDFETLSVEAASFTRASSGYDYLPHSSLDSGGIGMSPSSLPSSDASLGDYGLTSATSVDSSSLPFRRPRAQTEAHPYSARAAAPELYLQFSTKPTQLRTSSLPARPSIDLDRLAPGPSHPSSSIAHHEEDERNWDITRMPIKTGSYGCVYPGSVFKGTQKSGDACYDVTIKLLNVDFDASFVCGLLKIDNLTPDYPELMTYFDAEVIGPKYDFVSRGEWKTSEQNDFDHWRRFPAFKRAKNEIRRRGLTSKEIARGTLFLRAKEKFLVPDHGTQEIKGASFAGFYYMAISEDDEGGGASLTGYYFHKTSTRFQQLILSHEALDTHSSFEYA